jgi:hypothetical protein
MNKTVLLLIGTFIFSDIYSQKYDTHWMMGDGISTQDSSFGTTHINFNYDEPFIYIEDTEMNFYISKISMCDELGTLLFYSNGIDIHNISDEPMLNSEDFNYYEFHEGWEEQGLPIIQSLVSLVPVSDEYLYYLFHLKVDYNYIDQNNFYFFCPGLYYTLIDMTGDNGKGEVVEKGVPIIEDTLVTQGLTATRHANGRDWWLLLPERNSNRFYRVLLDPDGVHLMESQELGSYLETDDAAQAVFSPDGTWYVRNYILVPGDHKNYIDLYRFDRCTGLLSDHQRILCGQGFNLGGGAVFSPDSRFLYVGHFLYVYRYDLWADEIIASKDTVAIWDGFAEQGIFSTTFFTGQLAPDGKIYFGCASGASYFHLIHNPNGEGDECRFEQRGLKLTANVSPPPNFPNYRLGPIDGSPCDTLGINNLPLAAFNYYADSSDLLSINFWDYSYYEPTDWEWTFGDGATGSGQTPEHTYAGNGVYQVCLTASNEYGSDTLCKWLELSTTSIKEILPEEGEMLVYPNPTDGSFTVELLHNEDVPVLLEMYDINGRKVRELKTNDNPAQVDGSSMSKGIYTIKVWLESGAILTKKIVIVR